MRENNNLKRIHSFFFSLNTVDKKKIQRKDENFHDRFSRVFVLCIYIYAALRYTLFTASSNNMVCFRIICRRRSEEQEEEEAVLIIIISVDMNIS